MLDGTDALIHQPARLAIMALLHRHRDVSYTATRDHAGLTDGNLATHTKRLVEAGLIEARRVLRGRDGFEVRYRITRAGVEAFQQYLQRLRRIMDDAQVQAPERPGRAPAPS